MAYTAERQQFRGSFGRGGTRLHTQLLVAGGLLAANHISAELLWKNGPNKVTLHPGPPKKTVTLVSPGFGSLNGHLMQQDLKLTPFGDQPMLVCHYDNKKGANNKILAGQIARHQQTLGFEGMDAYAPSMGLFHTLEIARISGIPLHNVLLTGSPSHVRDARAGWLGYAIAKAFPYDFRLAGKFASTMIADTSREGVRNTPKNIWHSIIETGRGSSTMLLRSQMKFLGETNILRNWQDYDQVIIPGYTRFGYAAPLDTSDRTVYTARAFPGIQQFVDNFRNEDLDVPVTFIQLPDGAGHANTPLTLNYATQWMEQVFQRSKTEHVIYPKAA